MPVLESSFKYFQGVKKEASNFIKKGIKKFTVY